MSFDFSLRPAQILQNRFNMPEQEPLVSIITPFYNASEYFDECFNSVQNQTFPWFEWIIMDDGSTDSSALQILNDYAKRDSRIRVYHKINGGAASARNAAVEKATCDLLFFFDADDLIEENIIEMLFFTLYFHPEAAYSYTSIVTIGEKEYLWERDFSSNIERNENVLPMCSLVRTAAFKDVGGFDVIGRFFNEDWHLWLKLLSKRYIPAQIRQYSYWYRRLASGGLAALDKDKEMVKKNRDLIEQTGNHVPDNLLAVTFGGYRSIPFSPPKRIEWNRSLPFVKERIRILLIVPHLERGGADLFNMGLLQYMDKEHYELGIITTIPAQNEWQQQFMRLTNDVFVLPSFLDVDDWPAFVAYYIESRKVSIVMNISSYHGYYWFPWLRVQFPDLVLVDCVHAEGKYWLSGGYPRVSKAMDEIIDKTFCTNLYMKETLIGCYEKAHDKVQVIYTGVDEKEYVFDVAQRMKIRDSLGLGNRPIVLFLCRLSAEKRPYLMLEIARSVKEKIPNVCFLVVGGGDQQNQLELSVQKMGLNGTVIFTGVVPETGPYYACADLFLLSSIKEGLSITSLEAMAAGLPIVSAAVGSQYELVDESTGALIPCLQDEAKDFDSRTFDSAEIHEYAEAIIRILSDDVLRAQMGIQSRKRILQGYTRDILLETLDHSFNELLTSSGLQEKRRATANLLGQLPHLVEEVAALQMEYQVVDRYCASIASNPAVQVPQTVQQMSRKAMIKHLIKPYIPQRLWTFVKKLYYGKTRSTP